MMSVGLLHHVELYVSNLEESIEFWGWLLEELGYVVFQKWESGRSWKLADTYIVFVQTEDRHLDIPYHRGRVGLNHLAFHAKSREHINEMTEKLKEKRLIYFTKRIILSLGEIVIMQYTSKIQIELK